tara:strand:- start:52 stop:741 length:690 start_codon:yes stop_codon:yes gene_type:complete
MTYTINNKTFKTKAEIKLHYRKIKDKHDVKTFLKRNHTEDYNDLIELFKYHEYYEEKIKDMMDIVVKYNGYGTKAFYIVKLPDDEDIGVFTHCISQIPVSRKTTKKLKSSKEKNLTSAMRYSIQPQINIFRNNNKENICEFCKKKGKMEIDHIKRFQIIQEDFLKINTLEIPSNFDDADETHQASFKDKDELFRTAFYNYHLEKASLRYLCKKCNLSRGKKDDPVIKNL